jgi:hypothetical protein
MLGVGTLGLAGLITWAFWPKKRALGGLGDEHLIQQSTKFYEKKYAISADDARRLVTSPKRKQIEREVEEWRSKYGYPENNSPLVRGFVRDRVRALAGLDTQYLLGRVRYTGNRPAMLKIIANESRTPREFAERAEAWASTEAKPPTVATIAKAYRKASPAEVTRLVRQARAKRLAHTQARWQGYMSQKDHEDLID